MGGKHLVDRCLRVFSLVSSGKADVSTHLDGLTRGLAKQRQQNLRAGSGQEPIFRNVPFISVAPSPATAC